MMLARPSHRGQSAFRSATPILAALIALACASTGRSAGAVPSRSTLLADEIATTAPTTAYQAVSRLRPKWLRRRGQISMRDPSAGEVVVYLDGVRYGGARSLEGIRADVVEQMEFLDSAQATMRFGTGHAGGAILVRTR